MMLTLRHDLIIFRALDIVRIVMSARLRKVLVASLFSGSQKTIVLVSLETLCRNFVHSTQWPETTIGMNMKSRSATHPRMSCTLAICFCSCTQSGSTIVNLSDTSWGNEYSIHMVNNVMVHVDAISPSLHIWRSDYAMSTARSSLRQASWYLLQKKTSMQIEMSHTSI